MAIVSSSTEEDAPLLHGSAARRGGFPVPASAGFQSDSCHFTALRRLPLSAASKRDLRSPLTASQRCKASGLKVAPVTELPAHSWGAHGPTVIPSRDLIPSGTLGHKGTTEKIPLCLANPFGLREAV